tara:strand:+ start:1337 stop:2314 length:978 start_codon:yes stop_codon:yes gene_type:complete
MPIENQLGTESSLSNWAGPYVTDMLGKANALGNEGYQSYQGPLTAGASNLQNQAFGGIGGLAAPTGFGAAATGAGNIADTAGNMAYNPNTFTSGVFDTAAANQYMSPYLQSSLEPQLAEARRQADIQRVQNAGRLTRAGAYGGGRQAIMESEGDRNLLRNMADITGGGYNTGFSQARDQFNADQSRGLQAQQYGEQSSQFGAGYGLDALRQQLAARQAQGSLSGSQQQAELDRLNAQMGAGAVQRGITSEGVAADYAQFQEERDDPYKKLQYKQSMLQGLPVETQSYSYQQPSGFSNFLGGAGGILELYNGLFNPQTQTQTGSAA